MVQRPNSLPPTMSQILIKDHPAEATNPPPVRTMTVSTGGPLSHGQHVQHEVQGHAVLHLVLVDNDDDHRGVGQDQARRHPEGGDLGQSCAVLLKKNKIQDFIFIVSSNIVGYERFVFRFVSFVLRF